MTPDAPRLAMARQLRIEFPGAFYHVISRGNRKQPIFISDEDRHFFISCLGKAYDRYQSIIHAYCLMENHYHLLVETPNGQLSRIMQSVNTAYSVYFNKKHDRCGHLFQGRFKAILVQAEEYGRELGPYVHLNPVRAKLVDDPQKYRWSNYNEYLGTMPSRPWTSTSLILSSFGTRLVSARQNYAKYVRWKQRQGMSNPLKEAEASGILGTPDFVARIKDMFLAEKACEESREIPQLKRLKTRPAIADVMTHASELLGSRNRHARKAAIFVIHKNTDYSLREIGAFFGIGISAITDIYRRTRKELPSNDSLAQAVGELESRFFSYLKNPPQGGKIRRKTGIT
jgi:putative transposase